MKDNPHKNAPSGSVISPSLADLYENQGGMLVLSDGMGKNDGGWDLAVCALTGRLLKEMEVHV